MFYWQDFNSLVAAIEKKLEGKGYMSEGAISDRIRKKFTNARKSAGECLPLLIDMLYIANSHMVLGKSCQQLQA